MSIYRDHEAFSPEVIQEMATTCQFLYRWRKYEPMVAGGALWSWAANVKCRDADVFMHNRMMLETKLKRAYKSDSDSIHLSGINTVKSYYGKSKEEAAIAFTRLPIVTDKLSIDAILCAQHPVHTVEGNFDYEHCKVGFGPSHIVKNGAVFYSRGELKSQWASRKREEKVIRSKLQMSLWGSPQATIRFDQVIAELMNQYHQVEKSQMQVMVLYG